MKLALLIRRLSLGGAERQLVLLARELRHRGDVDPACLVFYGGGELEDDLRSEGVRVLDLERRRSTQGASSLWRLARYLRRQRIDVLYTFLDGANVAGALVAGHVPGMSLVWGVRASEVPAADLPLMGRVGSWAETRLSARPSAIICNSWSGRAAAVARGFPAERMTVVPNGCDTGCFAFSAEDRTDWRRRWKLPTNAVVIGRVGRVARQKGWDTFLEAASELSETQPSVVFVGMASGSESELQALRRHGESLGLGARIRWVSGDRDVSGVYSALDIATSSSRYGEGTPNVLSEAMSCGTPCVTTDVGDSRRVVSDLGVIVPPDDARALAGGWQVMINRIRAGSTMTDRERIRDHIDRNFSSRVMAERTADIIRDVAIRGSVA